MDYTEEDVRKRVLARMKDDGVTQADLAKQIGVSPTTINRFMLGRDPLSGKLAKKLGYRKNEATFSQVDLSDIAPDTHLVQEKTHE